MRQVDCGIVIAVQEEFEGRPGVPGFQEVFRCSGKTTLRGPDAYVPFEFSDRNKIRRVGVATIVYGIGPSMAQAATQAMAADGSGLIQRVAQPR